MQLAVTNEIFERLVKHQQETLSNQGDLTEFGRNDDNVFLLHDFMASYWLTRDGKIYVQSDDETPAQATEAETISAIVVAARRIDIPQLLDILPTPPQHSILCPACQGVRWCIMPVLQHQSVCFVCAGRGWATQQILQPAIDNGFLCVVDTDDGQQYMMKDTVGLAYTNSKNEMVE